MNRTVVPQFADATHVDRIVRPDGTPHESGDFSTFTLQVFDDEGVEIYALPATPVVDTDPVYDTLQTDGTWGSRDAIGYNFKHILKQTVLTTKYEGGRTYIALYKLDGGSTYGTVPVRFLDDVESLAPLQATP